MENNVEIIKKITKNTLEIMGFEAQVDAKEDIAEKSISIDIISDEAGFLIGQGGENLFALQHLIRLMARKSLGGGGLDFSEIVNVSVDINNYRKDRAEAVRDLAFDKADQAIREHRTISLSPMSSYDRRVVHMAIGGRTNLFCQSEGEGEERHIVIKPLV